MEQKVHHYTISLTWDLFNKLNKALSFDAKWEHILHREGQSLSPLKELSLAKSVAASARIKGAFINDRGVEELLNQKNKFVIQGSHEQEAVGYYELSKEIVDNYKVLKLSDGTVKKFHTVLLRYNSLEHWKRGDYRHGSQVQTAINSTSSKEGFKTVRPTFEIERLMQELFLWYEQDKLTPPLVKAAILAYDFLSVKPFDRGSGRLSRLCVVLLLLQGGYDWIQYASFEQEIELRKTEYERILKNTRQAAEQGNQDISTWVLFIMEIFADLQSQVMQKLKMSGTVSSLAQKHKAILLYIETHPGCRSGHIATELNIANSTAKRLLKELGEQNLVKRYGKGAGTNYTVY